MALSAGTRLGHYEVLGAIGAGGMGEVYRAHDTKLDREVAIKVLAPMLAHNPERLARFEREAKVLASLNHPHIAHIYGIEEASSSRALVMELVPGETLARTLKAPLPLATALDYARQIAEALEAAHEKGIIHRDLKPANIMVTPEGVVKVLDFGLAAVLHGPVSESADPANSPTITIGATQAGAIMGTAAYMAPEQARGQTADRRADVWAFGAVFYEMLSGKMAFEGENVTDILASVVKLEPDWSALPPSTPPAIAKLIRRCLTKDRKQRLQAIGEARIAIDEYLAHPLDATTPPPVEGRPTKLPWAVAAVVTLAAAALAFAHFREKPPAAADAVRFGFPAPEKVSFGSDTLAVSPDGRRILFTGIGPDGVSHIYVRSLDTLEAHALTGTEGVVGVPFWSADSSMIAFGSGGKLKNIDASGGPPQTVCDSPGLVGGGFWTADDRLIFGTAPGGISQVPVGGGIRSPVTVVDRSKKEIFHAHPSLLPDGKHFVYVRSTAGGDAGGIYIGSLDAKPEAQDSKRLLADQASPVYVAPQNGTIGHLLFVREGTLLAQPFDAGKLTLAGSPVPIAEQIASTGRFGVFSVSPTGVLAYRTGAGYGYQLTWFDRQGRILSSTGTPGVYTDLVLSPNGTQVATGRVADAANPSSRDIWLFDFARSASTRFTFGPAANGYPVWSPDGSRIAFSSNRSGLGDLYSKASNGTGTEEVLLQSAISKFAYDWSHDGRFLLYGVTDPKNKTDLWVLPLTGDHKPMPFLQTEFNETQGQFSPDGKWIAYSSDESGRFEIYVQPFPASSGGRWMVSNGGGSQPRWRRDGKELFYIASDSTVIAADVITTGSAFKAGIPKSLFDAPMYPGAANGVAATFRWDASADGQRFLLDAIPRETTSGGIDVVLNWEASLKK